MESDNTPNIPSSVDIGAANSDRPSPVTTVATNYDQQSPKDIVSAPEKTKLKGSIKNVFAKTNTNYKRNRIIAVALAVIFSGILIFILLLVFGYNTKEANAIKILAVTPTSTDGSIIKNDTKFIIDTENASTEKLRNAIYIEPAIDYQIIEKIPGQQYEVAPATTLPDNIVLNIDSVRNEVVDYKWAFQTKKDLSVSKIYPANGANYVSENSIIEFSFSYPDVEGVEEHFSITPAIDGTLTKNGRIWRFTPATSLSKSETYEITVTAGLTVGEETMTDDFHSSFSTFAHSAISSDSKGKGITLDGVLIFNEAEKPIIEFDYQDSELLQNSDHITIEKINTAGDYIDYLKGAQITGDIIGDYTFEMDLDHYRAILKQTLQTGYYIFHFKSADNHNLYTADVEINNIAAYAFESERDMIVWVAEDGELKSGVKINYKDQDYTTGNDGLLYVENISDYSGELDYLKIGDTAYPLVLALTNYKNDLYPTGFIYTDRPLYKPTDVIKVWGYMPLSFFKDAPNREGFSVVFDTIKQPVPVDEKGFFSTEINLKNYKDGSDSIKLVYNDQNLASRYIEIEDYSLENYIYEYIADKNYIKSGENINFKVKVTHVTGFPAINKDIIVTFDGHDYYGITNGQGEADFSLSTSRQTATLDRPSSYETKTISIKSGGADYNKYSTDVTIFIFKNNIMTSGTSDRDAGTVTFTADTYDLKRSVKTSYGFRELLSDKFSGPATIKFYETEVTRYISRYTYDEYTKENVPVYETKFSTHEISSVAVDFVNGVATSNYPTYMKEPSENIRYSYYAVIATSDADGLPVYSYNNTYYENNYADGKSNHQYSYNAIEVYDYYPAVSSYAYNLYRFGLKDRNQSNSQNKYSIGDHLLLGLYDYSGANVENDGKVLAVAYQESIISSNIFTDETVELEFDRTMYPGANIVGAYFKDGKFYRIAPAYRDYDAEDSRLAVEVKTDKTSYEPGETVKATVTAKRADGSLASGRINLSVVNESIFNVKNDDTGILESIYANKTFKSYAVSTFRDYELTGGGGRGAASGGRANFGDTIYFGEKTLTNGEAEFEFKLNDSITSFRLTALAVEPEDVINAGVGVANISSYLPLSITTTMPKAVKNTDDLVLNARSITATGDSIEYTFTIEELNVSKTVTAIPGQIVGVNFGKQNLGSYTVVISARNAAGNEDKMVYPIDIIETAQEISVKKTVNLSETAEITPTRNPIIVEIYNNNTSQYLSYLNFLENNRTTRLDTMVAYYKSQEYKNKYYNEESSSHTPDFSDYMDENGLLKPLPNAQGDYTLTALINYYLPDYFEIKAANFGLELSDDSSTAIKKLMVLASLKEPVLLELKAASVVSGLSSEDILNLTLAFMMIGDYGSASDLYAHLNNIEREDILAVLATSIDKGNATSLINKIVNANPTSDYLNFAIIGFFENNEVNLQSKSQVKITVNGKSEDLNISPLEIRKNIYYSNDLASLQFEQNSNDLLATYYYQGKISELGLDFAADIAMSINEKHTVGDNIDLVLDISSIVGEERNGELNIVLPSSLKLSSNFSSKKGLFLTRNNNEYVKLSLSSDYTANTISIPLYITATGNYELEPVVFVHNGNYHISNNLVFDI